MAWTQTLVRRDVKGSERVVIYNVTTDSAEQALPCGLDFIRHFSIGPISMSDAVYSAKPNLGTTGTAINGTLGLSGLASGDNFFLVVQGR